jgi:hypothetical protein
MPPFPAKMPEQISGVPRSLSQTIIIEKRYDCSRKVIKRISENDISAIYDGWAFNSDW